MNILAALGSPRKNGNSELAVRSVTDILSQHHRVEIDFVRLAPLKISPCIGCGNCEKTGECVIKDKMTDLYPKVDRADLVFLVSPTYFYGLSAQIKAFIDRIQARWSRKYLLKERVRQADKRKGYLVCTAATKGQKLFDGSILTAKSFFDAVDIDYGGELLIRGVDEKGAVQEKKEELIRIESFALDISHEFS